MHFTAVDTLAHLTKGAVTRDRTITESHDLWELSMPFRERSVNISFCKKVSVFFLNSVYTYNKNEGFKSMSRRQNVAEISAIHRWTLQSVLLANLYFNYDQSLVGPTGVQLLDFCCSSVSELICCWVLVLFHLSDESWFIYSLFWFIDE